MGKVTYDMDTMTATHEGVVVPKYARKLVQDALKADGIYGSTVWYEEAEDGVMYFEITNPIYRLIQILEVMSGRKR